jgi:ABC-2 type transport system permease protein
VSGLRQTWLVALRELRERGRSKGLWAGTVIMVVVVVAAIVVPAVAAPDRIDREVGFVGSTDDGLAESVTAQGAALDIDVDVQTFGAVPVGEQALRDDDIDVLVVDGRRLVWRGDADERLRAVVTGAIQVVVLNQRAEATGITADQLAELASPVPVENEEIGIVAGRGPDDEVAAYVMSILLLVAIATYGQLVLTGVVQEKSSRVVEVLLARVPARSLMGGKVAGIGLLGFAQFVVTAIAAVIATLAVDAADIPAVSGAVMAWLVVWFVLGYAIYATAYGAFGSLASRTEDASSISAPVTTLLIVAYWASLVAVTRDPDGGWATLTSFVPVTAPFAMPGRVALGAAAWWEPFLAAGLTVAGIAVLVLLAGRIYTGAILHTGAPLKLREAWRRRIERSPAGA